MPEEVNIISRASIVTYPKLGVAKKQMRVTYSTPDIPPRTIFIDEEKYNKETEAKLIKEDIARQRAKKVETIKV